MNLAQTTLYDIRFAFKYDNPFQNDSTQSHLKQLKQYINASAERFTEVNYLTDSRYLIICPDTKKLFGEDIQNRNDADISQNDLINRIKDFINGVNGISTDMKAWCLTKTIKTKAAEPITQQAETSVDTTTEQQAIYETEDFIPIMPNKFSYTSNVSITNYDISNDKGITYEDLRKLTINIARSKLVPEIVRDETVLALEKEKKKNLIQEITRYRNVRVIAMMDDSDLNEMNLTQLEQCLDQCIKHHEMFKTLELFKRGFGAGGILYDMIFPDGIPISKSKKLCFKGVGKEVLSTLFDPHTSVGLAFSNILQKHNVSVSDELLTLVAFGGICLSKVTVEDRSTSSARIDEQIYSTAKQITNNPADNLEEDELEYVSDEYE